MCEACTFGKQTRSKIPRKAKHPKVNILEVAHSDVFGPVVENSEGGTLYSVAFIDEESRWTTIYPMKKKSNVIDHFHNLLVYSERNTNKKLKAMQLDEEGENESRKFGKFLDSKGIVARRTAAHKPRQNGIAEQMTGALFETFTCMLRHKNVPKCFWANAIAIALYLRLQMTRGGLPSNMTLNKA